MRLYKNDKSIFLGTMMSFEVDNKPAFEIPLKDISQATIGLYIFFLLGILL